MTGIELGHYRVGERLGLGSLGEVFISDDLSIIRKAALKFLAEVFMGVPERMACVEREANLLASLNHPTSLRSADSNRLRENASSSWSSVPVWIAF